MFEHEANSLEQSATPAHCAEMHGAGMRRGLHAQSSSATSVPRWVALLVASATATVMAGCAIGPNYHAPKLPAPLPAQFVECHLALIRAVEDHADLPRFDATALTAAHRRHPRKEA